MTAESKAIIVKQQEEIEQLQNAIRKANATILDLQAQIKILNGEYSNVGMYTPGCDFIQPAPEKRMLKIARYEVKSKPPVSSNRINTLLSAIAISA